MRTQNTAVQVSRPLHEEPISGIVNSAIPYGTMVCYKTDGQPQDGRELILANKRAGFVLMQSVVSDADWQGQILQQETFPSALQSVLPIGQAVTARPWAELQVEGDVHLGASIDAGTVAETKLALLAGKWEEWVDNATSGEVAGIVDRELTPVTAGNIRISIRRPGSFAADPA